jgi:hypothetical protein
VGRTASWLVETHRVVALDVLRAAERAAPGGRLAGGAVTDVAFWVRELATRAGRARSAPFFGGRRHTAFLVAARRPSTLVRSLERSGDGCARGSTPNAGGIARRSRGPCWDDWAGSLSPPWSARRRRPTRGCCGWSSCTRAPTRGLGARHHVHLENPFGWRERETFARRLSGAHTRGSTTFPGRAAPSWRRTCVETSSLKRLFSPRGTGLTLPLTPRRRPCADDRDPAGAGRRRQPEARNVSSRSSAASRMPRSAAAKPDRALAAGAERRARGEADLARRAGAGRTRTSRRGRRSGEDVERAVWIRHGDAGQGPQRRDAEIAVRPEGRDHAPELRLTVDQGGLRRDLREVAACET